MNNENKGKYIIINTKFNCQSFPLNDNAIWVSDEDLAQIGVTKCFDVENNCVIDYDNTKDLKIEKYQEELKNSLSYLKETDYIANKLAEAISKYIEAGDNTDVLLLRATYKEQLEKRAECRKMIDDLEEILKIYNV